MMTIKSETQFNTLIDETISERRRELRTTKAAVRAQGRAHELAAACRGYFCLLYAHWEGFVKDSVRLYLDYVEYENPDRQKLATSIWALDARTRIKTAGSAKSIRSHHDLTRYFLDPTTERLSNLSDATREMGNLDFETFSEILTILGIEPDYYITKKPKIDESLVARRNRIAHGELEPVSPDEIEEIADFVDDLLVAFKADIQNAVVLRKYLRPLTAL